MRVIIFALYGSEYPRNEHIAHCMGCGGISFWVPNYSSISGLGIRQEDLLIQCSSCKVVSIIPANEFIRVEK